MTRDEMLAWWLDRRPKMTETVRERMRFFRGERIVRSPFGPDGSKHHWVWAEPDDGSGRAVAVYQSRIDLRRITCGRRVVSTLTAGADGSVREEVAEYHLRYAHRTNDIIRIESAALGPGAPPAKQPLTPLRPERPRAGAASRG